MILENGVIRTMDPALPAPRALAIAGDRIAGGVGAHETALASPDLSTSAGAASCPASPTRTSTSRRGRSRSGSAARGHATLDEALERVAAAARDVPAGGWLRGLGWRSGDWSPSTEPTKEPSTAVTGDTPAALMAHDYHSLWLNSAALARANGDLELDGGVVERDARRRADRRAARGVCVALP